MPQLLLTTAFQSAAALGAMRNYFLSGGASGLEIKVEGARTLLSDPVTLFSLGGPSGRAAFENDTVQFLRFTVEKGSIGTAEVWVDSDLPANTPSGDSVNPITTIAIGDKPAGGVIGTAAATVDVANAYEITQTSSPNQVVSLPAPSLATASRVVTMQNATASSKNILFYGRNLLPGTSTTAYWNGTAWNAGNALTNGGNATGDVVVLGSLDGSPVKVEASGVGQTNIATGNAGNTLIGNSSGVSGVAVHAGGGGFEVRVTADGIVSIKSHGTGKAELDSDTGDILLGAGATAKFVQLGNETLGTEVDVLGGVAGGLIFGTGVPIAVPAGTENAQLFAGSGGVRIDTSSAGPIAIKTDTTGAASLDSGTTGDVDLGCGPNAKVINIGVNAAGAKTINIGSGSVAGATVTLSADDGITLDGGTTKNGTYVVGGMRFKQGSLPDFPAGGVIGPSSYVDTHTVTEINQTTAAQTLTLPAPTDNTKAKPFTVLNVGTQPFTMYGRTVAKAIDATGSALTLWWSPTTAGWFAT